MSLIDVRGDISAGVCDPGLRLFCLLGVEMRSEKALSVKLRDFLSFGSGAGPKLHLLVGIYRV